MKYTIHGGTGMLICMLFSVGGFAQENPAVIGLEPKSITPEEQFVLANVPLLELPEAYKGPNAPLLPFSLDNSTQPYFRPITSQSGYECGQSAGIAFNFTYEIDRLRSVAANTPAHQYPTHFAWDFLNNGDNYTGASFFDSWEILKSCGTMNVTDYGGTLNFGGYKRWISGYNVYYNGMKNRVTSVKGIRVDNPEGLQTLKYWLWDHLEGSSVGGVANFYANYYGSVATTLPAGTPEAGKYVQTNWGSSPSHAWTVCGFNDSIRWDYNNDGQYTNNIDITGDGVVNMHDWEIGGLKFANGYAGTGWCNQGFCYLMYKTLADDIGYGGIWNHTVYVIDVKETCDPQLTMKVTMKHPSRNKIRVRVGMTTNLSSTTPDHILEFPVFNYQGGDFYMQGGTTEEYKTIEFGLDLTPLLSEITSNTPAKYFLLVDENDPGNTYPGEIINLSLIDYTGSLPEIISYPSTNVPLVNNGTTSLPVTHTITFSKPVITTTSLPVATIYQPYSAQLAATYGDPPYQWDARLYYPESVSTAVFPVVTAQVLTPTNNNNGFAIQPLAFPFPFYDRLITKLYVYADGFILFDDQPYTYPYLRDPNLLFRQTAILAPFMTDLRLYYNLGQGLWYEGDANSATIRWKASINNMSGSTELNFAVKFYPNGLIEYYYGNMSFPAGTQWTGGMSGGDNRNYQYSQLHQAYAIPSNTKDKFTSCGYPVEMDISGDGLFTGTPQYVYTNQPVTFRVTDNNGISNIKTLNFTTNGLLLDYTITAGGDSLIEFGETAQISFTLTNLGSQPYTGVDTWITEEDPYIVLTDSLQFVGTIAGGQTLTFQNAFTFQVSPVVPNLHSFDLIFHGVSNQQSFQTIFDLIALAPDVNIGTITLPDGDNGQLDPGETTSMVVVVENHGGAKVHNLHLTLSSGDPLLAVLQSTGSIPVLHPDSSAGLIFTVEASPQAPFEHFYLINSTMTGNSGFLENDSIWLLSGTIIEDFETGTTLKYPWFFGGDAPWYINDFEPYEGLFNMRSGWIYDNMESHMLMSVNVLESGEIRFWKRISCEDDPNGTDYDYLAFFIDDEEMGRWDGTIPWEESVYPVTTGYHTFKWAYHKDLSISAFSDCCWLDFISLPPFENALPTIDVLPVALTKTLDPGETGSENLQVENTGNGLLEYLVQVYDSSNLKSLFPENLSTTSLQCSATSFSQGETFSWTFTLQNASTDGEYLKEVRINFPAGVTINSTTSFTGGSLGDLVTDGTTGQAVTVTWVGESTGGRGVVKPGETATALVTGTVVEGMTFDIFLVWVVVGDNTGSEPHQITGEIRLANEGADNDWISVDPASGSLLPDFFDNVTVQFDATNLSSGDYFCDLLVRDLYNNIAVIPVFLHVNFPIATPGSVSEEGFMLVNYPNPFSSLTRILCRIPDKDTGELTITDLNGVQVKSFPDVPGGSLPAEFKWDGSSDAGFDLPPGIYILQLKTHHAILTRKISRIR